MTCGITHAVSQFTSGSGTYTTPAGASYLIVECVGGGGGAGEWAMTTIVSPSGSYSYSIGAGGAGGSTGGGSGGSGGTGGVTAEFYSGALGGLFYYDSGTSQYFGGGGGGGSSVFGVGGAGGSPTNGNPVGFSAPAYGAGGGGGGAAGFAGGTGGSGYIIVIAEY